MADLLTTWAAMWLGFCEIKLSEVWKFVQEHRPSTMTALCRIEDCIKWLTYKIGRTNITKEEGPERQSRSKTEEKTEQTHAPVLDSRGVTTDAVLRQLFTNRGIAYKIIHDRLHFIKFVYVGFWNIFQVRTGVMAWTFVTEFWASNTEMVSPLNVAL